MPHPPKPEVLTTLISTNRMALQVAIIPQFDPTTYTVDQYAEDTALVIEAMEEFAEAYRKASTASLAEIREEAAKAKRS